MYLQNLFNVGRVPSIIFHTRDFDNRQKLLACTILKSRVQDEDNH